MLEDGNVRNSIHSYSLDSKLENSDDKNANDKTEKTTLKVYLSNGNFNIVKFGEITNVKVHLVLCSLYSCCIVRMCSDIY